MRPSRSVALSAAAALIGGLLAAGPARASTTAVPTDDIVGEATVTSTELDVTGVDPDALDTLSVPEVPADEPADPTPEPLAQATPSAAPTAADELAVLTDQEPTTSFDVLGVTWDDASAPVGRVLVRTRNDGVWTDWTELAVDADGPDPGTAEAAHAKAGTEPLVAAGSDGIQVRVEAPDGAEPDGLAVTLVDGGVDQPTAASASATQASWRPGTVLASVGGSTTTVRSVVSDTVPLAAPTAAPTPDSLRPHIVTRAEWGADESIRKPIAWNSTIKAVIVHHTVNANDYTQAQAPAIVRSIYAYHVKGRGWSDVGYHFLVDRFGTVYEGRKGSIDKIPLGVHTGGFNTSTIGVSAIGDYGKAAPSTAMLNSIAQVAAWKLSLFGRDPLGTTTLTAGSGSTRQPPGWTGPVKVISGHRDLATTACPGQLLYDKLDVIRKKTAALMVPIASHLVTSAALPGGTILATHYASTGTVPWTAKVTSVCSGDLVRSLSGSGTRLVSVTWDGTKDGGGAAPPGLYRLTVNRTVSSTTYTDSHVVEVLSSSGAAGECGDYARYGGADRYATAVQLGKAAYPDSDAVVLVAGTQESVVDGLVAAPFARSISAPVLLTLRYSLPSVTKAEIARRSPSTVWLVGGSGVISGSVRTELAAMGVTTVKRLSGADRFGTAAAVARQMGTTGGVVLASGAPANLIDSASAGGVAAAVGEPILLVRGDALSADTRDALDQLLPDMVTAVGGTGAVSTAALHAARDEAGSSARRFGGADRYATAIAVADGYVGHVPADHVLVAAAGDDHLIDSVTGGALGRITLLVPGASSTPRVETWLADHGVTQVGIAGGAGAVSPDAVLDLTGAL